jgi:hypothetical protein
MFMADPHVPLALKFWAGVGDPAGRAGQLPSQEHLVIERGRACRLQILFPRARKNHLTRGIFRTRKTARACNDHPETSPPPPRPSLQRLCPPNPAAKLPRNFICTTTTVVPATSSRQAAQTRISEMIASFRRPLFPTGAGCVLRFGAADVGFGSTPRFHRWRASDAQQKCAHLTRITACGSCSTFCFQGTTRRLHAPMGNCLLA